MECCYKKHLQLSLYTDSLEKIVFYDPFLLRKQEMLFLQISHVKVFDKETSVRLCSLYPSLFHIMGANFDLSQFIKDIKLGILFGECQCAKCSKTMRLESVKIPYIRMFNGRFFHKGVGQHDGLLCSSCVGALPKIKAFTVHLPLLVMIL